MRGCVAQSRSTFIQLNTLDKPRSWCAWTRLSKLLTAGSQETRQRYEPSRPIRPERQLLYDVMNPTNATNVSNLFNCCTDALWRDGRHGGGYKQQSAPRERLWPMWNDGNCQVDDRLMFMTTQRIVAGDGQDQFEYASSVITVRGPLSRRKARRIERSGWRYITSIRNAATAAKVG